MIHLRHLLQEAEQTGATELRLSSSGKAEIKSQGIASVWHALPYENLGPQWTRENFLAVLRSANGGGSGKSAIFNGPWGTGILRAFPMDAGISDAGFIPASGFVF